MKKPAGETAYQRFATYEILDHGTRTVTPADDHVTFVHELADTNGYAYRYEKVVRVSAARLMGADCIISGVRPQIAQTIVHLGVDLRDIMTKATLADAFVVALQRRGLRIVRQAAGDAAVQRVQV